MRLLPSELLLNLGVPASLTMANTSSSNVLFIHVLVKPVHGSPSGIASIATALDPIQESLCALHGRSSHTPVLLFA